MKKSELREIIREEISRMLNEGFSNNIGPYEEIAKILETLHAFSDRIKFRVEWVNGIWNIVYNDEKMITQGILNKLRDRKFWNTGFDASIGKFPNNQINIRFDKSVQDRLNIENFDKMNWSPKSL
jgi:hypothetical protein